MKLPSNLSGKIVIIAVLASLASMFVTSFYMHFNKGKEAKKIARQQSSPFGTQGMGEANDISGHIMELMIKLKENPESYDLRMDIADHFMEMEDWQNAITHLEKAAQINPDNTRPLYLLGICQYKLKDYKTAAKSLEQVLQIKEEPEALYSLALIYRLHLNRIADGNALLNKIINSQETDGELKSLAQDLLNTPEKPAKRQ